MNHLNELRKDLKPIIELKRELDLRNLYDNKRLRGVSDHYSGNKEEAMKEGFDEIKNIIIELADKYKEERSE